MDRRKNEKSKVGSSRANGKPVQAAMRKRISAKSRQHDPFIAFSEWSSEQDEKAFRDL
jgi:hypothetical protein